MLTYIPIFKYNYDLRFISYKIYNFKIYSEFYNEYINNSNIWKYKILTKILYKIFSSIVEYPYLFTSILFLRKKIYIYIIFISYLNNIIL